MNQNTKPKEVQYVCEHIAKIAQACRELKVDITGCGCCGSPTVICRQCDTSEDYFHTAYRDYRPESERPKT